MTLSKWCRSQNKKNDNLKLMANTNRLIIDFFGVLILSHVSLVTLL